MFSIEKRRDAAQKLGNYKIGFDIFGLALFLVIMLPNFIWSAVPAVNDVLRDESITPIIDTIASIFQVIMILALCIIINVKRQKPMDKPLLIGIIAMILLYAIGWIIYYAGITNPIVILDLCIAPCLAFIMFSISRKNIVALICAVVFMICHVLYGIINFIT